jgi:hypothetical protein
MRPSQFDVIDNGSNKGIITNAIPTSEFDKNLEMLDAGAHLALD